MLWNLLLIGAFRHCVGDQDGGATPLELVRLVARDFLHQPVEALLKLGMACGLTATLLRALRPERMASVAPIYRLAA